MANIRLAAKAISASKWRSFMTMTGIIVGVASVVTTVSLGEGVKKQVVDQINQLGQEVVTVSAGQTVTRDDQGNITGINVLGNFSTSTLSEKDFADLQSTPNLASISPISSISGKLQVDGSSSKSNVLILATNEQIPNLLKQKLEYGSFFDATELDKKYIVLGKNVAEQLFGEPSPIGKTLKIRDHDFIIRGVFEQFQSTVLSSGIDYNNTVFIPFNTGKQIMNVQAISIAKIIMRTKPSTDLKIFAAAVDKALLLNHGGQQDYTVLRQDENLKVANTLLTGLTTGIAAIAGISLLVGGIGIMNIMLFTVSERTKEIGIRKAIGATNRQIANQFLTESVMLSLLGGTLGVLLSLTANLLMRLFTTSLKPVISAPIIIASIIVSTAIGVFFGVTPALKAARKDPIQALRRE